MKCAWFMILASVSWVGLTTAETAAPKATGLQSVKFYAASLKVPTRWRSFGSSHIESEWVQQYLGPQGQTLDLTRMPLPGLSNFPWLPLPSTEGASLAHPYTVQSYGSLPPRARIPGASWYQGIREAASGIYQLAIDAPFNQRHVVQEIVRSWTLQHPIDATTAMSRIQHRPTLRTSISWQGDHGWFLTAGDSATGSAPWYLYRTMNRGKTWQVIAGTQWTRPFPDESSPTTMDFLNGSTGFILQLNFAGPSFTIYNSQNGGVGWSHHTVDLPATPTQILGTKFNSNGTESLWLLVRGHSLNVFSSDGGRQWTVRQ